MPNADAIKIGEIPGDAEWAGVADKRRLLDAERPLKPSALAALERLYDIELTYASNAIESGTLTASETQLVIEHGVTVGGKPLAHHLDAVGHHAALGLVRELARGREAVTEHELRGLHALVLGRTDPTMAGRYATRGRFVLADTGRHAFPSPAEVPALMADFAAWLASADPTPATAFDAHRHLVDIHPFDDGNGRTARLLINLFLLRGGWSAVSIGPAERLAYIRALAWAQAGGGHVDFDRLMRERLEAALDMYLAALAQAWPEACA